MSSRIPPNQQLVNRDRWPLVGERQAMVERRAWTLTISGCVQTPITWDLAQLRAKPWRERLVDIHCVTRWSKLDVNFRGIALVELLEEAQPATEAHFISFVARSERRHSSSLPLTEAVDLGAMVAFEAEGKPLTDEHGGPMRIVVPGKYFYKSVKWVEAIELLNADRLGYWEADAGYHNGADPWREERYMAPTLSKQQAARLIASRDFSNQDLRSINASERDLVNLVATGAMLRDANFHRATLRNANFTNANLSNAHFAESDLRGANFRNADIEGTDFAAADLRGANLCVSSMFGASFCRISEAGEVSAAAKIDESTEIDGTKLDALTFDQKNYLLSRVPALKK